MVKLDVPMIAKYNCDMCGIIKEDRVLTDSYTGDKYCHVCEDLVEFIEYEYPLWISIASYEQTQSYGGPEEGGWYYSTGNIVKPTVRNFYTNELAEAEKYYNHLLEQNNVYNNERRLSEGHLVVKVYAEKMADNYYPKNRPFYH